MGRAGRLSSNGGYIMAVKIINGGYASDYDDFVLWIEEAEVGADAAHIADESSYTPCKVTKVIRRSDYDDEDEYSADSDEIIDQSSATCTGELITDEDTYYVEIDAVGDTEEYDSVDYEDVYFC